MSTMFTERADLAASDRGAPERDRASRYVPVRMHRAVAPPAVLALLAARDALGGRARLAAIRSIMARA